MKYDFNEIIDRRGSGCYKYDSWEKNEIPEDVLPMWVADMDIKAPEAVAEEIRKSLEHGIFGYTDCTVDYYDAVAGWFKRNHGYCPQRQWLVKTSGVVQALATAVLALSEAGDSVVIQQPVYYPFSNVIKGNDRELLINNLKYKDGRYSMDYDDLEEKLSYSNAKMMILCNPHNPVGRVWTREELKKVAAMCLQYDVYLVSDEIHCDFTYGEHKFNSIATMGEEILNRSVICTAPSKTFNIAGLQISNIFIPNREIRHKFKQRLWNNGVSDVNMIGSAACKAVYNKGGEWLAQLKEHLAGNIAYLNDFISERIPEISVVETEGTYLVWLDVSNLGFEDDLDQNDFIVNEAKLWLDTGSMFGECGSGFERMNIAVPRATLEEAMQRLEAAVRRRIGR